MDQTGSHHVFLYIYDLSKGMARQLSPIMLGKQLEGIWHTAIVVYGKEYFFGGQGICHCPPCGTILGPPDNTVDLGYTEVPEEIFQDYLTGLGGSSYRPCDYNLLEHNCNTFSSEVAEFLTNKKIPSYITDLPAEVLSTPFGQALRPLLESVSVSPGDSSRGGQP